MGTSKPPPNPLIKLSDKLRSWPPSILGLLSVLDQCESFSEFVKIIEEFLPESQDLIMLGATVEDQISCFAGEFENRYFPLYPGLQDGFVEEYEQITIGIPVEVRGIPYDIQYSLDYFRPGLLLMTSLLDVDFEGRIPLLEECKKLVPANLLQGRPLLSVTQMEQMLDDTEFKGLINWAKIWTHDTGFYFLDATYEDCYEPIPWELENVLALKRDWDESLAFEKAAYDLADWIEKDMHKNFKELIDFIKEALNELRTGTVPVGDT